MDDFSGGGIRPQEWQVTACRDKQFPKEAVILTFSTETATLGEVVRCQIDEEQSVNGRKVEFCGYNAGHPLVPQLKLFIRDKDQKRPLDLLDHALEHAIASLDNLESEFVRSIHSNTLPSGWDVAQK